MWPTTWTWSPCLRPWHDLHRGAEIMAGLFANPAYRQYLAARSTGFWICTSRSMLGLFGQRQGWRLSGIELATVSRATDLDSDLRGAWGVPAIISWARRQHWPRWWADQSGDSLTATPSTARWDQDYRARGSHCISLRQCRHWPSPFAPDSARHAPGPGDATGGSQRGQTCLARGYAPAC